MKATEAQIVELFPRPKAPWTPRELQRVREISANDRAQNTRDAYRRDLKRFTAWCAARGVATLPASVETLKHYVREMDAAGYKVGTIKRALSAIHYEHTRRGLRSPKGDKLANYVRGLARERGSAVQNAPAILRQDLKAMVGALDVTTNRGARDSALLLTGWAMACRRSEVIALDVGDLEIQARGVVANIRKQKNDPEGVGYRKAVVLANDPTVCTTLALRRWLRVSGTESGPVFRPVYNGDRVGDSRLSARACDRIVKRAADLAGLGDMGFSSHSLRAGFVTQAAKDGKPLDVIAKQTGHRSLATLMGYIRRAVELNDDSPTAGLL